MSSIPLNFLNLTDFVSTVVSGNRCKSYDTLSLDVIPNFARMLLSLKQYGIIFLLVGYIIHKYSVTINFVPSHSCMAYGLKIMFVIEN